MFIVFGCKENDLNEREGKKTVDKKDIIFILITYKSNSKKFWTNIQNKNKLPKNRRGGVPEGGRGKESEREGGQVSQTKALTQAL